MSRAGDGAIRLGPAPHALAWPAIAVGASVVFGIVNDQVTITISPEYLTVFKRAQFAQALEPLGLLDAPARVQAVVVGTLSTWWFGLILGAALSLAGARGTRPRLTTLQFTRAVLGVMAITVVLSVVSGALGYVAGPHLGLSEAKWPFLAGIRDARHAFAAGAWHDGAYVGAVVGTSVACVGVRRLRCRMAEAG